jgi:hypothetical protein
MVSWAASEWSGTTTETSGNSSTRSSHGNPGPSESGRGFRLGAPVGSCPAPGGRTRVRRRSGVLYTWYAILDRCTGRELAGRPWGVEPGAVEERPEDGSGPLMVADVTVALTRTSGDRLAEGTVNAQKRKESRYVWPPPAARAGGVRSARACAPQSSVKAEAGPERVRCGRRATSPGPPVRRSVVASTAGLVPGAVSRFGRPGLHGPPPRTRAASRTAR